MSEQDAEIEWLKASVSCAALLERLPPVWRLDRAESTRRSLKYRRGEGEIVIVNHDGRGWWDPLSEAKGDIFTLVQHLDPGLNFARGAPRAARLRRDRARVSGGPPRAADAGVRASRRRALGAGASPCHADHRPGAISPNSGDCRSHPARRARGRRHPGRPARQRLVRAPGRRGTV